MTVRFWDIEGRYKEGFVKDYDHWVLEVSFRQHTLGCLIIFAKRNIEKISQLNISELVELTKVMGEIETAFNRIDLFKPERFNYLQMGNTLHRLHFHCIPRYITPRKYKGKVWVDRTWGMPPLWTKRATDKKLILSIRKELLNQLSVK